MKRFLQLAVVLLVFISGPALSQVDKSGMDFSTFIGGTYNDRVQYVYVDKNGYIYLAGNTASPNFPTTPGAYDRKYNGGRYDAFIAKLSPDGKTLIWSTYLGGGLRDQAYGLRVDDFGYVYVVGATGSKNFPVTDGAYDTEFDGGKRGSMVFGDAFAAKITPDGSKLVYSTFIGGPGGSEENPRAGIFLDVDGNLFVAGKTESSRFPTTSGAYQEKFGGGIGDGFIIKLSADGSRVLAATYLGGSGDDYILEDIIGLPDGSLLVGGLTASDNFPVTPGVIQMRFAGPASPRAHAGGDGFVTRISPDLSRLIFSTYFGGSRNDSVGAVDFSTSGEIIISGTSTSVDLPTTKDAFDRTHNGKGDCFVAILNRDGTKLKASTYVGGEGFDALGRMRLDASGRIYLAGWTRSTNLPVTPNAYQSQYGGGKDALISVLSSDLSTQLYTSYIGGDGDQRARGLWLDPASKIVVSGDTFSADFPITKDAVQQRYRGDGDGYLLRLDGY